MQSKTPLSTLFFIFLISFPFTLWCSISRFIARDEGFYALATKLVSEGKIPYRDFFYPQTPLMPYVYAAWETVIGSGWHSLRIFNAILFALLITFLYKHLRAITGKNAAILGSVLLTFNGLSIGWYSCIKTYCLSTLLLFFSYGMTLSFSKTHRLIFAFLAGIFLGLTINIRLFLVVSGLVFFLMITVTGKTPREKLSAIGLFLLGGTIPFLPHIPLLIADSDAYWFNNMGYHLNRTDHSPERIWKGKILIIRTLLGLEERSGLTGLQFPILIYLSLAHAALRVFLKQLPHPAFFVAAVLFLVNLIPSPSWIQYFSTLLPFLCICTVLFFTDLWKALENTEQNFRIGFQIAFSLLALVFVVSYTQDGIVALRQYLITGRGVHGVDTKNIDASKLKTILHISSLVNENTKPGEPVLSQWPGFLYQSHATPVAGFENQFWVRVSHKLSYEEQSKLHLGSIEKLENTIRSRSVPLAVIEKRRLGRYFPRSVFDESGYTLLKNVSGILIYQRVE